MAEVAARRAAFPQVGTPAEERRRRLARAAAYTVLIGYALLMFVPFAWQVATSFKTLPASVEFSLIPREPTIEGYRIAATQLRPPLQVLFFNSTLVATIVMLSNILLGGLGGYAFARLRFPGRELLFVLVLATLMMPDQLRLVPVFQILINLGLITSSPVNYVGLWLVLAVQATSLFFMRQYFMTIPRELEEAARIDGAGFFTTYWRIMLPLAAPAIATVAILQFQSAWNNFFWPLIVLREPSHWTLPLGLAQFRFAGGLATNWPALMAVATVATVPILLLYLRFQRYFVSGLLAAALKE